jgi:hypothetical protein
MNNMNKNWEAIPEWPKGHRRKIRSLYLAIHNPFYTGRFKDYAFPLWWRNLFVLYRREKFWLRWRLIWRWNQIKSLTL